MNRRVILVLRICAVLVAVVLLASPVNAGERPCCPVLSYHFGAYVGIFGPENECVSIDLHVLERRLWSTFCADGWFQWTIAYYDSEDIYTSISRRGRIQP